MRKSQVLVGVVALLLTAGAGVALRDGSSGRDDVANSVGTAAVGAADVAAPAPASEGYSNVGKAVAGTGAGVSSDAARVAAVPAAQSRVIKTATLTVSVKKDASVAAAAQKANSIAERLGGFVAGTESHSGDNAMSTLELRVPVASYDAALRELRSLGEVSNETLGGRDVSSTLVDLDARLRSLRAQETALNSLMAKANSVGETLQVAQAVSDVRTQIEQLAAQQKNLTDQADFATITLVVAGPAGVPVDEKPAPVLVDAARRAAHGTLDVLGGTIVVLGYALPAALLAAAGYGVVRLLRRRPAAVAS